MARGRYQELQVEEPPEKAKVKEDAESAVFWCLVAAVCYGSCSVSITFFNKSVFQLWDFHFPLCITVFQIVCTLSFYLILPICGIMQRRTVRIDTCKKVAPLCVVWTLNVVSGISSLERLSIPMQGTLRRLTALFVLMGEAYLHNKHASLPVQLSVVLIVLGAFISAYNDLAFDLLGYTMIMVNNMCTAMYLLLIARVKKDSNLDNTSLLFYMNVVALPPFLLGSLLLSNEWVNVWDYLNWDKPAFYITLVCSCAQAFLINYTTFWCTTVNSPLTTSIVGQLSKILTIAFGYLCMQSSHPITPWNVFGVLVGLGGSVAYSVAKYQASKAAPITVISAQLETPASKEDHKEQKV